MNSVSRCVSSLLRDESGQDLIEYALVAAIIGLGAVTIMGTLSTNIVSAFTSVSTGLTNATGSH